MTKEAAEPEGTAGDVDRIEEGLGQLKISDGNHGQKSVTLLPPNTKSTNDTALVDVEQHVGELRLSDEEPAVHECSSPSLSSSPQSNSQQTENLKVQLRPTTHKNGKADVPFSNKASADQQDKQVMSNNWKSI